METQKIWGNLLTVIEFTGGWSFTITHENMTKNSRCYIIKAQKVIIDSGSKY